MNNNLVFISPIGNTDPIRNLYDGPMIHIARKYMPNKIYLLLTNEMYKKHLQDDRYILSLKQLYSQREKDTTKSDVFCQNFEYEIIKLNIDDASDFEAFSNFTEILEKIIKSNDGATFIANVSSGSPQMISSLALSIVVNNFQIRTIQVKSPNKKSNKNIPHTDEYNLNNSFDNDETFYQDRCVEVNLFNFRRSTCYHQLRAFIAEYDYSRAIKTIKKENFELNKDLLNLLAIGEKYTSFETDKLKQDCKKYDLIFNNFDSERTKIINAYNLLKVKRQLKRYSDLVVSFTPLFFLICKRVIMRVFDLSKITYKNRYNDSYFLNLEEFNDYGVNKIEEFNKIVLDKSNYVIDSKFLITIYKNLDDLKLYCPSLCKECKDLKIYNILQKLRNNVEINIRNKAAHDTVYITEEDFSNENVSPDEILLELRELINYAFENGVKQEEYNFLEDLNKKIKNELKKWL